MFIVELYEFRSCMSMKEMTTKEVSFRCLSGVNCVYYGLKSRILVEVDDLFVSGRDRY
jgi:hypothetical protein